MIDATLVTVHGFWSSPATWDRLTEAWHADPDLRDLAIHGFGYPSPKLPRLPLSSVRIPDLTDIAQTLATDYTTILDEAGDVAIVTHSQGGLIVQRFLAWMINEGRGGELARIKTVIMLACPNGGSEYLRSVRHILGYRRHPQARSLEVLDRQVADTQRTVLDRVVKATRTDDYQCPIPFHVYAGSSDGVVSAASAQAAFPGALTLAGDHFSILDPSAPGNRIAQVVTLHIRNDLTQDAEEQNSGNLSHTSPNGPTQARVVNVQSGRGLQIGDNNTQHNVFGNSSAAADKRTSTLQAEPGGTSVANQVGPVTATDNGQAVGINYGSVDRRDAAE